MQAILHTDGQPAKLSWSTGQTSTPDSEPKAEIKSYLGLPRKMTPRNNYYAGTVGISQTSPTRAPRVSSKWDQRKDYGSSTEPRPIRHENRHNEIRISKNKQLWDDSSSTVNTWTLVLRKGWSRPGVLLQSYQDNCVPEWLARGYEQRKTILPIPKMTGQKPYYSSERTEYSKLYGHTPIGINDAPTPGKKSSDKRMDGWMFVSML
jgi:hypothetical protein